MLKKLAGFDGVELHSANGYLVTQFLDSTANKHTDKWGGSAENRSRFGLETLKYLVEVFGSNLSIKLAPCGGMPLEETVATYSYFIAEAEKLDLSYFTLMGYSPYLEVVFDGVSRATPRQHDLLETYKPFIKNAKIFLNAGFTPEEGAPLVSAGKVDGVCIGMSWVTHPDLGEASRARKAP